MRNIQNSTKSHSLVTEILATISIKKSDNLKYEYITLFNEETKALNDTVRTEKQLCRVGRQVTLPAYTQASVLVNSYGAELMTNQMHSNVVEHQYSINLQGLRDMQHGKPFYVYIAKLTARPTILPRFMIVG